MKILYLDLFAGISGDMTLGAFLDLGVDKNILLEGFKKLNLEEDYEVKIDKVIKNGITGTKVDIILDADHEGCCEGHDHNHEDHEGCCGGHDHDHEEHEGCCGGHDHHHEDHEESCEGHHHHHHEHRNLYDIEKIIDESSLDGDIKDLSKRIFKHVAIAESKVHSEPLEKIHFHEVGATDSILDIVGAAICIKELDVDRVVSTPLHVGTGFVNCQHGMIPVPVPATLEILKDNKIPTFSKGINKELVTPTGAAIVAELVDEFEYLDDFTIEKIGYGAGTRDLEIPNMVRMVLGVKKK